MVVSGLGECRMPTLFYYFAMIANNKDCMSCSRKNMGIGNSLQKIVV
jgi:hypothetical protein